MNTKLDLFELINKCPIATISVGAAELGMFARQLIAECRREFERERAAVAAEDAEKYWEPEFVKTTLKVSDSTLYRWQKAKILEPVWIGGQKRYRKSDIERIISGTN